MLGLHKLPALMISALASAALSFPPAHYLTLAVLSVEGKSGTVVYVLHPDLLVDLSLQKATHAA